MPSALSSQRGELGMVVRLVGTADVSLRPCAVWSRSSPVRVCTSAPLYVRLTRYVGVSCCVSGPLHLAPCGSVTCVSLFDSPPNQHVCASVCVCVAVGGWCLAA